MQDLTVDNTILKDIRACETKGAMLHVLHLTTAKEVIEIESGAAVHEVLAWWASGKTNDEALARLKPYQEWAKTHVPPDDDRLSGSNVRRITARWLKKHPLESWQFVVKPEEVEVPLIHPLGDIKDYRVTMVALLDLIGKRRTGGRWSVDHKTTKQINDWFQQDQEDSSQFTGQLWLAKQKGIMLSGIYINAIEYPRLPGSDRKCSTHGGVPYKECQLEHANTKLIPITRTPRELDAWELTARKITRRYIWLKENVETIQDIDKVEMGGRFTRSCGRCEFREWCRVGRPHGSAKTFKKRVWDPVEHAKKGREKVSA